MEFFQDGDQNSLSFEDGIPDHGEENRNHVPPINAEEGRNHVQDGVIPTADSRTQLPRTDDLSIPLLSESIAEDPIRMSASADSGAVEQITGRKRSIANVARLDLAGRTGIQRSTVVHNSPCAQFGSKVSMLMSDDALSCEGQVLMEGYCSDGVDQPSTLYLLSNVGKTHQPLSARQTLYNKA